MSADGGQCTQLWATLYLGPDRCAMGVGTDHDHRVDYRSNPLGRLSDMRLGMTLGLVGTRQTYRDGRSSMLANQREI